MAKFNVSTYRHDPYKNFKFLVKWDNRVVAGVSKVGGLKKTTEVVTHREGGDPSSSRKSPGKTEFEAITLERGVTHDVEFEQWANKVWNFGAGLGEEVSLKDFRKHIRIELLNEAGQALEPVHELPHLARLALHDFSNDVHQASSPPAYRTHPRRASSKSSNRRAAPDPASVSRRWGWPLSTV